MKQDAQYFRQAAFDAKSRDLALTAFGIYAGIMMEKAMIDFDAELRALVDEWVKRGDDPVEMIEALTREANRLPHPADTGPINDS